MSASSRGAIATSLTSQTEVLARTWSGRAYGAERRGSPRGSDGGGVTSPRRLKVNNEKRWCEELGAAADEPTAGELRKTPHSLRQSGELRRGGLPHQRRRQADSLLRSGKV
ncbi:hypothetical protein SRHO_G00042140 [Serrasalmus rhombeus]